MFNHIVDCDPNNLEFWEYVTEVYIYRIFQINKHLYLYISYDATTNKVLRASEFHSLQAAFIHAKNEIELDMMPVFELL